jgi:predicted ATPase
LASALNWWQCAGSWAVKRSAYLEAAAHFTRALELVQAAPADADSHLKELDLQIAFGQVMLALHGFAATETVQVFKKARQLATAIEDISQRCAVYYALWAGSHVRAELAPMREMAEAFMLDVALRPSSPEAGTAHRIAGVTKAFEGRFEEAKVHLQQALDIYDPERDRPLAHRFGQDNAVAAQGNLALVHWALGEVEQARQVSLAGTVSAQQSGHAPTMAYGHAYRCFFKALSDDPAGALCDAEALVALSKKHNMHWWAAAGLFYQGLARWHAGQRQGGESEMRHGLALCREHGLDAPPCHYEMLMADVEFSTAREHQALARLDHLVARIALTGEHWLETEVQRRRAVCFARLQPDEPVLAERALMQALSLAGEQRARTFELRVALALADHQGRANSVIESIYAQFEEPLDLPEWREMHRRLSMPR